MNVTGYELFEVPPRWLFLRLDTDEGLVGWGEPIVEGKAPTVRAAVGQLLDNYLVGTDPLRIGNHWQMMYRGSFYRGGPILMSAIAGIDQALWDIKGKHYGAPVYDLLGGQCRDRVPVYQWIGGDRPTEVAAEGEKMVDAGYGAVKMDAIERMEQIDSPAAVEEAVDRVRHVRETLGDDVDICVDFRGRASTTMARQLANALEPFSPMFIEEPVAPENDDNLSLLAEATNVPIATGERRYSRWDFKSLLHPRSVDVVQPDVSHAGGITEVVKIAHMAHAHDVAIAPNCPLGPIALASSLQVTMAVQNALIQDHGFDSSLAPDSVGHEYLADPGVFEFDDGYVVPPDEPGLGITIDEDAVREKAGQDINWHNPVWRHGDGSAANW